MGLFFRCTRAQVGKNTKRDIWKDNEGPDEVSTCEKQFCSKLVLDYYP